MSDLSSWPEPASVWPRGVDMQATLSEAASQPEEKRVILAWVTIVHGLHGAIARYKACLNGAETGAAARAAFGEALWWIAAGEEFFRKVARLPLNKDWYPTQLGSTSCETLAALVYARHRAGHQFADILNTVVEAEPMEVNVNESDGSVRPVTFRARVEGLFPFSQCPEDYHFAPKLPESSQPEKHGRDAEYARRLAGKPVLPALEYVAACFDVTLTFTLAPPVQPGDAATP